MKRTFNRLLATVLTAVMLLSCCTTILTLFASAEGPDFAWASAWTTVDGKNIGCWQSNANPGAEAYTYDYAIDQSGDSVKVGVKFYGTLTGTLAAKGNGNGTNLRVWIKDPALGYVSYNYFADVAYTTDGGVFTRLAHNTNATGNTASWMYNYVATGDSTDYDYTYNITPTDTGADMELVIPKSIIGNAAEYEVVVTVSNKVTTNYALYSTPTFNAASAWPSVWDSKKVSVDGANYGAGVWQNAITGDAPFTYTTNYHIDNENLYFEVDYSGTFSGTLASYGNGAGTMIRLWMNDSAKILPTSAADPAEIASSMYTYFIDISYVGDAEGKVLSRLLANKYASQNSAGVVAGCNYTDTDKPYTIENVIDEEAGTWVMKLTMPLDLVCGDVKNLTFQPSVSTLVEGVNNALYFGTTKNPYTVWTPGSAMPHVAEYPVFGDDVLTDASLVKGNLNIGATQIDYLTSGAIPQYAHSLNDGITADPTKGFSYGDPWYSFYINSDKTTLSNPTAHIGTATFDYGAAKTISEIAMQVAPAIGTASSIKAYASNNNVDWLELGTLAYEGTAIQTINLVLDKTVDARFVKVEIKTDGMFFMVSEIMVYEYNIPGTINIGNLNAYGWGNGDKYPVILAYGNGTTPSDAIGGPWFTWWDKVRLTWSQADHCFLVSAVEGPGSTAYEGWVLGEHEVALICYMSTVDTASQTALRGIGIGDKVWAYGFDFNNGSSTELQAGIADGIFASTVYFATHAPIEGEEAFDISDTTYPGYFTDVVIPEYSTPTNIAVDAIATHSGTNTGYPGSVNDGVAPATGYTPTWRAYNKGTITSTFDLGSERSDIGSFSVWMWPANQSGIVAPESVKFYASIDARGWFEVGALDLSDEWFTARGNDARWVDLELTNYLDARYIKMEVTTAGTFSFIGEVKINALAEISTYDLTDSYRYATDSAVLISSRMGATLDEVNPNLKNHEWWSFATLEWDVVAGAYKVTAINIGDGVKANTDYGDLAIPDYGFVLGGHHAGSGAATEISALVAGLEIGDYLYLYGEDFGAVDSSVAFTDAFVSVAPIDGLTAYAPSVISLKTAVGFAGGDATIFTRITTPELTELTTIDEIAAYVRGVEVGDDTDYNYYGLIVVDSANLVTEVNFGLGRPDYAKGATVVPEGGYVIALNAAAIGFAEFQKICVGDTITLVGVDPVDVLQGNPGATVIMEDDPMTEDINEKQVEASTVDITGAFFGFEHIHAWGEDVVVDPTCTEDGYTHHVCSICNEDVIIEGSKTLATGHVSDEIVHVKEPTCAVAGYSYNLCTVCNEELKIEGSDVPATGIHTYEKTSVDTYFDKHVCSVCGDFYYADKAGTKAIDLKVSHCNQYNWGTFESMIITGDGKTVTEVINQTPVWWVVYVVENINGSYVATSYKQNVAEVATVTVPVGGFLYYVYSANSAYAAATGGALVGYVFNAEEAYSTAKYGIDTTVNPARHMYAVAAPAANYTAYDAAVVAANALDEDDYTAETWADLAAALAVDVADLKSYEQTLVDNAALAITDAIAALEAAAPAVVYGDLDGNGVVEPADISLAIAGRLGNVELTAAQLAAADVDKNGTLEPADISLMIAYRLGNITEWPTPAQP